MSSAATDGNAGNHRSRKWIKTALALQALSPTSVFARRKAAEEDPQHGTNHAAADNHHRTPMPLAMMKTLEQLIAFLEEHHRREEGLYHQPGDIAEVNTLLSYCRAHQVPELSAFGPHAITGAMKIILAQDFLPLIEPDMSRELLESALERDEMKSLSLLMDRFERIRPPPQHFLSVFLNHLHHVSTSIPCRMNAKSLARAVGKLLFHPHNNQPHMSAMTRDKSARKLARLMIENAPALPSNYSTALELPEVADKSRQSAELELEQEVYFVQITWNETGAQYSEASLMDLFRKYGDIVHIVVNVSKNRAIIAFATPDGAQTAASADVPGVRIRRRKQRSFLSESVSPKRFNDSVGISHEIDIQGDENCAKPAENHHYNSDKEVVPDIGSDNDLIGIEVLSDPASHSLRTEVPKPSRVDSQRFLRKLERPPSLLLAQRALKRADSTQQILVEDVESPPASPRDGKQDEVFTRLPVLDEGPFDTEASKGFSNDHENEENAGSSNAAVPTLNMQVIATQTSTHSTLDSNNHQKGSQPRVIHVRPSKIQQQTALHNSSTAMNSEGNEPKKNRMTLFSPSGGKKAGFISEIKGMLKKRRSSTTEAPDAIELRRVSSTASVIQLSSTKSGSDRVHTVTTTGIQCKQSTSEACTQTMEPNEQLVQSAEQKNNESVLRDIREAIETAVRVLSTSGNPSDKDVGIIQLHRELIDLIDRQIGDKFNLHESSATAEFLAFIEMRSQTQIKLLEAEIRAGQELLRLHRSQHEKEIVELETELTATRLARVETEKLCGELRAELRKSRNELTCYIASAATVKREKRDVDEKLVVSETRLQAREQEILRLQIAHDEMREVAAKAQMRLESSACPAREVPKENAGNRSMRTMAFPKTNEFLQRHKQSENQPQIRPQIQSTIPQNPGRYSNAQELADMKETLQGKIQSQLQATRDALHKLRAFEANQTIEDEAKELVDLQRQLVSAEADIEATMASSRSKLEHISSAPTSNQGDLSDLRFTEEVFIDPHDMLRRLWGTRDAVPPQGDGEHVDTTSSRLTELDEFMIPTELQPSQHVSRDDLLSQDRARSELFARWAANRTRGPPVLPRPLPSHDNQSLIRAQESMKRFQETLAGMQAATSHV